MKESNFGGFENKCFLFPKTITRGQLLQGDSLINNSYHSTLWDDLQNEESCEE